MQAIADTAFDEIRILLSGGKRRVSAPTSLFACNPY